MHRRIVTNHSPRPFRTRHCHHAARAAAQHSSYAKKKTPLNLSMTNTLQVLRPESHPALYSIVLGEGVMNDATAVALLRAVPAAPDTTLTPALFAQMLYFFAWVFASSFALGFASGLAIAAAMKHLGPFSQPQVRARALPSSGCNAVAPCLPSQVKRQARRHCLPRIAD